METSGSKRPERRTALVGRELPRYDVDVAALSETRLGDIGQVTEVGAGYTFFWSGRGKEERRDAGIGFAVKKSPGQPTSKPTQGDKRPINDLTAPPIW